MSTEPQPEVMVIQEAMDGGAVVELPPSIPSPDPQPASVEGGEDSDEADDRARQREMAVGGAVDADAEALREAKRQKRHTRKEYHKRVQSEKDVKLSQLERQNNQLLERLAIVERKTLGSELARLDSRIEEEAQKVMFARQKIKEAADTSNGDLLVSAQDMLVESSKNYEMLANLKKRSIEPQQKKAPTTPVNPMLQRHAKEWMRENPWYDPSGKDPDSRRALTEDQILVEDGYDPTTAEYWDELTNRLASRLPHLYNTQTEAKSVRTSRPRNVVTASGRESSYQPSAGSNSITLSPEQVRAMKDAGMWDDPEKRAKMIRRYAFETQNIRNRS